MMDDIRKTEICVTFTIATVVWTYWGRDKMAAILADDIFKCILFNKNCCVLILISLKYVFMGPIHNMAAMVQLMAWRQTGDKPLSDPVKP